MCEQMFTAVRSPSYKPWHTLQHSSDENWDVCLFDAVLPYKPVGKVPDGSCDIPSPEVTGEGGRVGENTNQDFGSWQLPVWLPLGIVVCPSPALCCGRRKAKYPFSGASFHGSRHCLEPSRRPE